MAEVINMCKNGHYFLEGVCPHCGEPVVETLELRKGDCIRCGQLCPDGAYACHEPVPVKK